MDSNTITAKVIAHEPVEFLVDDRTIPLVVGFNPDGSFQTAVELVQRALIAPSTCDHAGATWSPSLVMRCPKCGSSMFLPPKLLAHLPAATISAMDLLWSAAGWAEWGTDAWRIPPEHWTIVEHPLFAHCCGLAVRNNRREQYYDALVSLAEDDHE
jgi:hypothetical protein